MPAEAYHANPYHGVSLNTLFRQLVEVEGYSPFEARALLTDTLGADDVVITPALPSLWQLILLADGGIALRAADGDIPGNKVFVRPRQQGEITRQDSNRSETPASSAAEAAKDEEKPIIEWLKDEERPIIEWLSTWLQSNKTTTKEAAMEACRERFPEMSGKAFDNRIWPAARLLAGLPRRGNVGRPKGSTNKKE